MSAPTFSARRTVTGPSRSRRRAAIGAALPMLRAARASSSKAPTRRSPPGTSPPPARLCRLPPPRRAHSLLRARASTHGPRWRGASQPSTANVGSCMARPLRASPLLIRTRICGSPPAPTAAFVPRARLAPLPWVPRLRPRRPPPTLRNTARPPPRPRRASALWRWAPCHVSPWRLWRPQRPFLPRGALAFRRRSLRPFPRRRRSRAPSPGTFSLSSPRCPPRAPRSRRALRRRRRRSSGRVLLQRRSVTSRKATRLRRRRVPPFHRRPSACLWPLPRGDR